MSNIEGIALSKKLVLNKSVAWIMLQIFSSCVLEPQQYYDTGVSDDDYVSFARANTDAQAFLEKYPQAETQVDRSGRLAVDFRVTTRSVTDTTQSCP